MSPGALRTREHLDDSDKKAIREAIASCVEAISAERSICPEAVANEAFYLLQRNSVWGRNPTSAQKRASFKQWQGLCHRCRERVEFDEAKFHHLKRGVPDQHGPANLVPEHLKCHDDQHDAAKGSLSKGSPVKKGKVPS